MKPDYHMLFAHYRKKLLRTTLVGIVCGATLVGILLPQTHYRLGSLFFGDVPALYNINLAQRFFVYAAYPLVGRAPVFAHYQLSRTYFIQGVLDTSLTEALRELEQYPENVRTYYILGLTYGYLHQEQAAIEAFSQFIAANPTSWAARNDKAWLQFRIGDIAGAIETIEPVSGMLNPWVQNTYGTLLLNAKRYDEAEMAFIRAQESVDQLSESGWGSAYPGNDPRVYGAGLQAMKSSIAANLELLAAHRDPVIPILE